MTPEIHLTRLWSDDDLVELGVRVADGSSLFANQVYVKHEALDHAVASLGTFASQVHGGLLDVRLGEFGPEYAGGAFHARFHFAAPGWLFVTCAQESEFVRFAMKEIASRASLHLRSEAALLDRFVAELTAVSSGTGETARLEGSPD